MKQICEFVDKPVYYEHLKSGVFNFPQIDVSNSAVSIIISKADVTDVEINSLCEYFYSRYPVYLVFLGSECQRWFDILISFVASKDRCDEKHVFTGVGSVESDNGIYSFLCAACPGMDRDEDWKSYMILEYSISSNLAKILSDLKENNARNVIDLPTTI